MTDINTVSLSGTVTGKVETSKAKDVSVARFYVDIEGAGDKRTHGNFKVVAFGEQAELAKELSDGDQIVLVGALLERRGRGTREMEIRARNIISLSRKEQTEDANENGEEESDEDEPELTVEPV